MTTEQRLERLERENRWMRRIGAVGVAVAAAVFLVGQGKEKVPPNLVARSLTLKDKEGTVHAYLAAGVDGSSLIFVDKAHKMRASLIVGGVRGARLTFHDRDGKARAGLGTLVSGSPHVTLSDAKGNVIWQAPR
ncbi:MAG: hypothetical protein ACYS0K_23270 [Planctomycetota bacterium]|jgi:hypothetical protein